MEMQTDLVFHYMLSVLKNAYHLVAYLPVDLACHIIVTSFFILCCIITFSNELALRELCSGSGIITIIQTTTT